MKSLIPSSLLAAALLLAGQGIMAQQSAPQSDYVVAQPVINMHSGPSADSDVTSQVIYGSGVHSLEVKSGWLHIRTADDYTGWVQASDVQSMPSEYAPAAKAVRVSQLGVNIYRDASVTKHAPVLHLPWESRLEVVNNKVDKDGRWLQVRLVDGQTAYVQNGDVTSASTPINTAQMVELAHKFLGITYTWGGVSSFGYDCSGFMQMLMRQHGVFMPRDADVQAAWSGVASVERKDLRPGDLLYFGSGPSKITHTGMYVGGGKFIHDTTHEHPGIQIDNLDEAYWSKIFVAARRAK